MKGKHVLTEKLMAHNVAQCKVMARLAEELKGPAGESLYLATGHQRHYSVLYDNAVHLIRWGMLGQLHHIRAQWHRGNLPGNDSWQPPMVGGDPDSKVDRIKADFNRRVTGMSSFELEYLLDDLDAKFKVMDSPEARDARAWVGQYLSAMSDSKRAETLKDVPNVVTMSAGELQREITAIEAKRGGIRAQQAAFDQSRRQMVQMAEDSRKETAAAAAAGMAAARASFSPYRNQGPGQTPFANVRTGADMEFMGWGFGMGLCRF